MTHRPLTARQCRDNCCLPEHSGVSDQIETHLDPPTLATESPTMLPQAAARRGFHRLVGFGATDQRRQFARLQGKGPEPEVLLCLCEQARQEGTIIAGELSEILRSRRSLMRDRGRT
jgi:hypothetical protein